MVKYRSSKLVQKKKKEFLFNFFIIIAFILSITYIFSEISKIKGMNIQKVNVVGCNTVDINDLTQLAENSISGNYFFRTFSKGNIFIYPRNEIKNKILNSFSRIRDINLKIKFPNTLEIKIFEYEPYAVWCDKENKNNCFFIDKEGFVFDKKIELSNILFEYHKNLNTNNPLIETIFIFEKEKFKEIDSFIKYLDGLNLNPYKLVVDERDKYEIYFKSDRKIIFDDNQNIRGMMDNFQAIMNMDDFNINDIEYIDLRFGNKVFYK